MYISEFTAFPFPIPEEAPTADFYLTLSRDSIFELFHRVKSVNVSVGCGFSGSGYGGSATQSSWTDEYVIKKSGSEVANEGEVRLPPYARLFRAARNNIVGSLESADYANVGIALLVDLLFNEATKQGGDYYLPIGASLSFSADIVHSIWTGDYWLPDASSWLSVYYALDTDETDPETGDSLSTSGPVYPPSTLSLNLLGNSLDLKWQTTGNWFVDGSLSSGTSDALASEWWPYDPGDSGSYPGKDGSGPVWDTATGARLRNPKNIQKMPDGSFKNPYYGV